MAFETKQEVLEKVLKQEKPLCPHCNKQMEIWEVPDINFGDGLGWGEPYLFLCFNDECPVYVEGWDHMKETYAHNCSYRCMCYPKSGKFELMPVFSPFGGTGQTIDEGVIMQQEALKESIKRGFSILAGCWTEKDPVTPLRMLMDSTEPARVRVKAAEMIGDLGELEAIEPLRNLRVGIPKVDEEIQKAVKKIHQRHFTRECPFCAEIIKQRAKVCKHCKEEVAGV